MTPLLEELRAINHRREPERFLRDARGCALFQQEQVRDA